MLHRIQQHNDGLMCITACAILSTSRFGKELYLLSQKTCWDADLM